MQSEKPLMMPTKAEVVSASAKTDASQSTRETLGVDVKRHSAFLKLKTNLADVIRPSYYFHEDAELLKYLVARRYGVQNAEAMFRKSLEFREKMRSDYILEEYQPTEMMQTYMVGGIPCFDKDGCPVRIEMFGCLDTKGMVYACRMRDLERFKVFEQEATIHLMRQQSAKLGRRIDTQLVIMDLQKISLKQLWGPGLQVYLSLVKMLEDNYPEFVKKLIVVNAPRIFPIFYKACRPLISEDMRKKIMILGSNYKEELLKLISAEELPAFLGGKQTDPDGDPRCTSKIRWGGTIPESYYLKDMMATDKLTECTVSAGSMLVLNLCVAVRGSVIRWEFITDGHDIAFGIRRRLDDGLDDEDVIPVERVKCHVVPENGSFVCEETGTYTIMFDNSYSWSRAKKLQYSVEVIESDRSEAELMRQGTV